jgi:hypothetical protein
MLGLSLSDARHHMCKALLILGCDGPPLVDNRGQIMPNVAISVHASAQQRVEPFPGFADLEFLNRSFRRGRRIRCLDKADEFDRLSP